MSVARGGGPLPVDLELRRGRARADRVVGQIHHARALGASGFTIFNYHPNTASEIAPGVGLGATSKEAVPPHRDR